MIFDEALSKNDRRAYIDGCRSPQNPGPGIGCFKPGVTLFVGDRSNSLIEWPFISNKGCSVWLAEQLEAVNAREDELYWINAYPFGAPEENTEILKRLEPKQVIAFGATAGKWVRTHTEFSYSEIPHPQYWKRFHFRQQYPLLDFFA
jgi:hypothetical protein